MLRVLPIALALALFAVPALADSGAGTSSIKGPTSVNLDADPDLEEIMPLTVADPSGFPQKSIVVYDQCRGTELGYHLGTPQENVDVVVQEVDGTTSRPEIRVIASSGASGRVGFVLLARLGSDKLTTGCPMVVSLFRWSSTDPSPKPPKGYSVSNFGIRYKDLTPRYQGKEIELTEGLAGNSDALCCPSRKRVSRWRFDAKRDAYVRYYVKVTRPRKR
jgi:hypothetical protein